MPPQYVDCAQVWSATRTAPPFDRNLLWMALIFANKDLGMWYGKFCSRYNNLGKETILKIAERPYNEWERGPYCRLISENSEKGIDVVSPWDFWAGRYKDTQVFKTPCCSSQLGCPFPVGEFSRSTCLPLHKPQNAKTSPQVPTHTIHVHCSMDDFVSDLWLCISSYPTRSLCGLEASAKVLHSSWWLSYGSDKPGFRPSWDACCSPWEAP